MNYKRNRRYFDPMSHFPFFAVILILIAISLFFAKVKVVFPILFLLVAAALIAHTILSQPTDEEIDAAVASRLEILCEYARAKLNLPEETALEVEPMLIHGYCFRNSRFRMGKDRRLRTSKYEAAALFFTARALYSFACCFSLIEDLQEEYTFVAAYDDLTTVTTKTEQLTAGSYAATQEYLYITANSATNIYANITGDTQQTASTIRQLILDKKAL